MKWGPFREGIEILARYIEEDAYAIRAGHGQFWAGPKRADAVSDEDQARLEELGWFVDEASWSCHV